MAIGTLPLRRRQQQQQTQQTQTHKQNKQQRRRSSAAAAEAEDEESRLRKALSQLDSMLEQVTAVASEDPAAANDGSRRSSRRRSSAGGTSGSRSSHRDSRRASKRDSRRASRRSFHIPSRLLPKGAGEGWLFKRSKTLRKNWKRRYFVVEPDEVRIAYKSDRDGPVRGYIDLRDAKLHTPRPDQPRSHRNPNIISEREFTIQEGATGRKVELCAATDDEFYSWIELLRRIISAEAEFRATGRLRGTGKPNKWVSATTDALGSLSSRAYVILALLFAVYWLSSGGGADTPVPLEPIAGLGGAGEGDPVELAEAAMPA